jgi:hypothetical protein
MENIVMEDVIQDPVSISSTGTAFTIVTKQNLNKLYWKNQDKDVKIRELEEQLSKVRIEEGNLQELIACAKKFKIELEESIKNMYSHLHVFQQVASNIME